ncbi:sensor histidine kinase [Haloarcula sediminis]|uniref:sensor histidine kinase n=1 Tax=Haloarcula sediminis TaxID=3111777 RepID=UPI002D78EBDA|nr:ATP-binding protein [Haloarcula sp. CK38]
MNEPAPERRVVVAETEPGGSTGVPAALAERSPVTVVTVDAEGHLDELVDADALVVVDDPPATDGVAIFRRVRRADWTLPVVLVSEAVDPDRVEAALSAGVTEYLTAWTEDRAGELAARIEAHVRTPALDGIAQAERWEAIASSLAHDAKNPLNVVTGRLELLDVEDTHGEAIKRSVRRVEALLSELSTIGSAAGTISDTEPVDLAEMARRTWTGVGGSTERLRVETAGTVQADPEWLCLVLERLFENAVDHAGDDATVTVGDTGTGFYVADDGPGIPTGDREQVFEQGYGTTPEGEGYGLFVAERVATAHGWDIVASESEAGGARFDIGPR